MTVITLLNQIDRRFKQLTTRMVRFRDNQYGVRLGVWPFYVFLDNRNETWGKKEYVTKYCHLTAESALRVKDQHINTPAFTPKLPKTDITKYSVISPKDEALAVAEEKLSGKNQA